MSCSNIWFVAYLNESWSILCEIKLGNICQKYCMTLGFKSPKALFYLQKGADHHKLWHLLEIIYVAFGMELVYPYVKESWDKGLTPYVQGYWDFCEKIENPNYAYIQDVTFTQLHGLMMLRAGKNCEISEILVVFCLFS